MIKRHIAPALVKLAGYFPVVTVLGPRQFGKTTLVKSVFPDHTYLNMEDAYTRSVNGIMYANFRNTSGVIGNLE